MTIFLLLGLAGLIATATRTAAAPAASCVDGAGPLAGIEQRDVAQATAAYAGNRQTFAAAAAAYIYGFPMVDELATLKGYVHNTLVNVDALATPSTQGVVSPNVDTAYSVAWIDLTQGPLVFTVPESAERYYTVQFMDADTNAFAYVGAGSTGTAAGSFAILPPGWSGHLPAGVQTIQAPTNTVWLLGRTLVNSTADLPAVKAAQAGYKLTPLAAYEAGIREGGLSLAHYPNGKAKAIPTGAKFIGALNQELQINPPPAADACAVAALAPAGISAPTSTSEAELSADLQNVAGVTPAPADDPAVDAGLTAGKTIVAAAASQLQASLARTDHGWEILTSGIGTYGTQYLQRAIIATDYLGANTPSQGLYPNDAADVDGQPLTGSRSYTITFPRGDLPPAGAFWSLTMYGSDNYLYANPLDRYAIGNRTAGLTLNRNGSLTLELSNTQPAQGTSNWLPAPQGNFHVILRLYEPATSALTGVWRPPPIFAAGETLTPRLTAVGLNHRTKQLTWTDDQATRTRVVLISSDSIRHTVIHRDRARRNSLSISRLLGGHLPDGTYRIELQPLPGLYDTGPGRVVSIPFVLGPSRKPRR